MLARLGVGLLALAAVFGGLVPLSSQPSQPTHNMVVDRNLAIESGQVTPDPHEQMLSGGVLDAAEEARRSSPASSTTSRSTRTAPSAARLRSSSSSIRAIPGNCETTGCNDITLAVSTDRGKTFHHTRITTSSMPNLVPANNPSQAGFLGDYMNVAANSQGAYIVWADTRPHIGTTPTENIFFSFVPRSTFGTVQK